MPDELEYIAVAALNELPRGERLFLDVDGKVIVLFNINGSIYALGDVCTHDNGPLGEGELDGHAIHCPRHGARFDVRTGKALSLPAVTPTPSYPVRVQNGMIEVGLPA